MTDVQIQDLQPIDEGVPIHAPMWTVPPEDGIKPLAPAGGIMRGMGIGIAIWIIGSILLWVLI